MPRAAADKPYVNFSNGLITEATGLNYPENSLSDILNMDIDANGSVRRRLGLELENRAFAVGLDPSDIRERGISVHVWDNAGGDANLRFLVICAKDQLIVRNLNAETVSDVSELLSLATPSQFTLPFNFSANTRNVLFVPRRLYSGSDVPINSNLTSYQQQAASVPVFQSTTGAGKIFFTSAFYRPFFLDYDRDLKTIRLKAVGESTEHPLGAMLIRDFSGIEETSPIESRPVNLTEQHAYNLINQGWTAERISKYKSDSDDKVYPSNAQQWVLGKNGEDVFEPDLLDKQDFGGSPAPKGSVVYDVLDGRRDGVPLNKKGEGFVNFGQYVNARRPLLDTQFSNYVSFLRNNTTNEEVFGGGFGAAFAALFGDGKKTLPINGSNQSVLDLGGRYNVTPDESFTTCCFFAGRVFFAGDLNTYKPNGVYFSRTIQSDADMAFYCQVNDPTSEHFTDLLDTDGGVLYIQEAGRIIKLIPFGAGVLVFATKGVWYIRGSDSGFKATDYSVDKIADVGVEGSESIVKVEGGVVYWTESSIMAIKAPDSPAPENLSDARIFNFYQRIDRGSKAGARGVYDVRSKRVVWLYFDTEQGDVQFANKQVFNRALILDIRTGAFFPYSFPLRNDSATACVGVSALIPRANVLKDFQATPVTVGDEFVTAGGTVTVGEERLLYSNERYINSLKAICPIGAPAGGLYGIMEFKNVGGRDFSDLGTAAPANTSFRSYIQTPPETLGDIQRDKAATYVHCFFQRTERYFYENGFGVLELDRPSGCLLNGIWDWHVSNAGGRYSLPQEAYRFKRPVYSLTDGQVFDNGEDVVYTKLKVRGQGRTLSLRFEAQPDKDFHLLGVSVAYTAAGS